MRLVQYTILLRLQIGRRIGLVDGLGQVAGNDFIPI